MEFKLDCEVRTNQGKGASRRLRKESQIPAIIYGEKFKPIAITMSFKAFNKILENEDVYSSILNINVEKDQHKVILKDLQRHPSKYHITHADFLKVTENSVITTKLPIHFINEDIAYGVKTQSGIIQHTLTDIEVQAQVKDLPHFIEVDIKDLKIEEIIHLSDIILPTGLEIPSLKLGKNHDLAVVKVAKPKGSSLSDTDAEGESGDVETPPKKE